MTDRERTSMILARRYAGAGKPIILAAALAGPSWTNTLLAIRRLRSTND